MNDVDVSDTKSLFHSLFSIEAKHGKARPDDAVAIGRLRRKKPEL